LAIGWVSSSGPVTLTSNLHPGDHIKALLRQAHGGLVPEAGARPRDEDLLECWTRHVDALPFGFSVSSGS
jgi:hypothetical protein